MALCVYTGACNVAASKSCMEGKTPHILPDRLIWDISATSWHCSRGSWQRGWAGQTPDPAACNAGAGGDGGGGPAAAAARARIAGTGPLQAPHLLPGRRSVGPAGAPAGAHDSHSPLHRTSRGQDSAETSTCLLVHAMMIATYFTMSFLLHTACARSCMFNSMCVQVLPGQGFASQRLATGAHCGLKT